MGAPQFQFCLANSHWVLLHFWFKFQVKYHAYPAAHVVFPVSFLLGILQWNSWWLTVSPSLKLFVGAVVLLEHVGLVQARVLSALHRHLTMIALALKAPLTNKTSSYNTGSNPISSSLSLLISICSAKVCSISLASKCSSFSCHGCSCWACLPLASQSCKHSAYQFKLVALINTCSIIEHPQVISLKHQVNYIFPKIPEIPIMTLGWSGRSFFAKLVRQLGKLL